MVTVTDLRVDHLAIALQHAHATAWPVTPQFRPERRWHHRISDEPGCEVWLLTWLPGQGTELHDHGGSAGAFTVVTGALTEETVGAHGLTGQVLNTGEGRRFGAHHVHRVHNHGTVPAVSIHVYGPALSSMTRYELDGGQLVATGIDRAGVQW